MLYIDTSALLPYYRQEPASEQVQALFSAQQSPVLISRLTKLEVASALARWVRTRELSEAQANRIEAAFFEDCDEGRFMIKALTVSQFDRANHWLLARKTTLRTLDALHLACAAGNEATLVTLDDALFRAAEYLGLHVRQP
ncbi:type II toxin-antitoxin system VapC family toxin [Thiohalophilus sp.]|uniref:type II toxin-antitoxin system VapC family toxin n=1 Tax=Thiohalophilus sp. TaxID=3028392 RepID=UPI002ACE4023|nr:type II toxin-antitoxin system VapC family toxin [Thiohalophilus sp.]MDZ7662835.1 type II toxin-antitoxin system VapC family toxin [Thiohalophilus sp.]